MESLELFEKLKTALGEDVAFELVQMHKPDLSTFATKEDLLKAIAPLATKEELKELRNELKELRRDINMSFRWLIGILSPLLIAILIKLLIA